MVFVYLLNEDEKNSLIGYQYTTNSFFKPIKDYNNNWVISVEEVETYSGNEFTWLKNLSLIEYIPKVDNP